jgi:tetratricopeptide (TPR) repeat protein
VVDLLDQTARDLDAEFPGASKIKGELLHTLGWTYRGLGLYDRAVELLTRALSVRQAALGPDHPDTLHSMYGLAMSYMGTARDRPNEAMPYFQEALKVRKAKLGADDPDTLESMLGLAWAYMAVGRLDESTSLNEEALRLRKAKLGPDHPDTLNSMFGVALAYQLNGRLYEAIPLYKEALELQKAKLGPDNFWAIQSMWGLAWAYQDADQLDEAIRLSEVALELSKAKFGADNPNTLDFRAVHAGALGRMWLQQKKYTEAEPLLREDLSGRARRVPNDWTRFYDESLLGESLRGQNDPKKFDEAERRLIEGYKGMKEREAKIPAPLKRYLTEAGERVVRLYEDWGKPEEAAKWRARLARELPAENNEPKP